MCKGILQTICTEFVRNLYRICTEFVQFVQNLYGICTHNGGQCERERERGERMLYCVYIQPPLCGGLYGLRDLEEEITIS